MDPRRYADLFRSESPAPLSEINIALLELEERPADGQPVHVLFRAVHTLKGMSASMGYDALAAFAHELESLLDRLREGTQRISAELMDILFAATDALEAGVARAVEGANEPPALATVLAQLRRVAADAPARDAASQFGAAAANANLVDEGPGVLVRVRQRADTVFPGVRAFMALQRARTLGDVVAVSPPVSELQAAETAQAFAFRLVSTTPAVEIEAAIASTGDVEHVEVSKGRGRQRAPMRLTPAEDAAPAAAGTRYVRIELARLDAMVNLIAELAAARGRLLLLAAGRGDPALDEEITRTSRLISDLQAEVMASRRVPAWHVFDRFPRLVRDAARQLHKEIEFTVEGKDIEIDRFLLDEIGEPVMHLLRNAVDHGIEPPDVREALGKPRTGRVVLSVARDGSAALVRVRDDGRGIDRERVLARALELGLVGPDVTQLEATTLLRLIARPGFSTAAAVSGYSGRGVGVDAVQSRVRHLGGTVELATVPGQGTTITLRF
ncbi:MAG: Hpt domain-containing protein [Gemmatimonadaceae bacterium]|nr:Hpt domain-containing protein [Gemmatimonadaceae bacterium]